MLFIISNSIIMKNLINVQKITEIPTFYPCEFLKFCIEHSLKPPNISSKNGKALVVMLNNIDSYFDRNTCNEFVQKFNIETKDSIQLFNKHEQWGLSTSREKSKYYIEYPYKPTNKPKMRRHFKYGGTEKEKIDEIKNIKSKIHADYIDVPNNLWQLGHKNPHSEDNSSHNLVLQPPIQAKYRDNYIFLDTLTKFPTPKHFKKCIDNNDIILTNEQIEEYINIFQGLLKSNESDDPLSDHLQRSLQIS